MTHFTRNAAAYCMIWWTKRADGSLLSPSFLPLLRADQMKNMAMSRKGRKKKKNRKKTSIVFFFSLSLLDVIGRFQALDCKTHTDCKQQHFLTCKQSQNPPIKANFNPASPFFYCSFFFFCLKGNSAVWWVSGLSDPPDSLELPSHFAELRTKYTECTARAMLP